MTLLKFFSMLWKTLVIILVIFEKNCHSEFTIYKYTMMIPFRSITFSFLNKDPERNMVACY